MSVACFCEWCIGVYVYVSQIKSNQTIGFINVWSKTDYVVGLVLHTRKQKEIMEKTQTKKTVEQYRIREGSPVDVRWAVWWVGDMQSDR